MPQQNDLCSLAASEVQNAEDASQEELYLEDTEEELRIILTSKGTLLSEEGCAVVDGLRHESEALIIRGFESD